MDIFIIVLYLPYYWNIRYVVLSFEEIKTHYYYSKYRDVAPLNHSRFFEGFLFLAGEENDLFYNKLNLFFSKLLEFNRLRNQREDREAFS